MAASFAARPAADIRARQPATASTQEYTHNGGCVWFPSAVAQKPALGGPASRPTPARADLTKIRSWFQARRRYAP